MQIIINRQQYLRLIIAYCLAIAAILLIAITPSNARNDTRTLYLYYTHTKETAKITFKRNGRYIQKGLDELNHMTRDWRRNEPTKMDPALFDLVWEVYQESGATGPIHIVSAYRSPKTNEMLRSRSRAVAKGSRHTTGQALDFFIPGVSTRKLREIAMKKQSGGVGYYPASNSPFVHLDTGNVRAWPRMTRAQLAKLFPDGKTLHVPNTGVPLSNKGYQLAMADWKRCRTVPCNSKTTTRNTTRIASTNNDSTTPDRPKRTLFDLFFGDDENEGSTNNNVAIASNTTPKRQVTTARIIPANAPKRAPIPMPRPIVNETLIASAPIITPAPAPRPNFLNEQSQNNNLAIAAIKENSIPSPRVLFSREQTDTNSPTITAYAPEISNPISISSLMEQQTLGNDDTIRTASVSPAIPSDELNKLIENTWNIVATTQPPPTKINHQLNITQRKTELVAPDLNHVIEIFTDPRLITSNRYAYIYEPDEADFDPALELGNYWHRVSFEKNYSNNMNIFRFKTGAKLIVASR